MLRIQHSPFLCHVVGLFVDVRSYYSALSVNCKCTLSPIQLQDLVLAVGSPVYHPTCIKYIAYTEHVLPHCEDG